MAEAIRWPQQGIVVYPVTISGALASGSVAT
jgi:hypothetical protein